jgi:muconolactone D-isomerase
MDVHLPHDLGAEARSEIAAREKEYSQELQRSGKWRHIWHVAGENSIISIFDVDSAEELHELISGLPLFPYLTTKVTPLAIHPSSIEN